MAARNVVVAQSGGPTCVINNSLRGIVETCRRDPKSFGTVYAGNFGIEGVLKEELIDLSATIRGKTFKDGAVMPQEGELTLNAFSRNTRARRLYERLGYGEDMVKYVKELRRPGASGLLKGAGPVA